MYVKTPDGAVWWRVKLDGSSAYVVPAHARRDGSARLRIVPRSHVRRVTCSGCEYWTGRDETWRSCLVEGFKTRHDESCDAWEGRE